VLARGSDVAGIDWVIVARWHLTLLRMSAVALTSGWIKPMITAATSAYQLVKASYMGKTKAQPKACPICSQRVKSTKDHVIPRWLRKEVVHLGLGAVGPSLLLICESCNRSLGKQFEDQVPDLIKPMLRRQEMDLSPGQQALLAGWLCKTSVLLALADAQNPADGSASRVDRRNHAIKIIAAIRDTGQPPPSSSVRIGLFDANPWQAR